jgi:hypothetical protein
VLFDQIGEFVHQDAALSGGEFFAPRAVVESCAGGGDCFVHIGGVGFGDFGDDFSGGWVDGWEGFAGGGVHPFVVDEQLGCGDFYRWFKDCGGSSHD